MRSYHAILILTCLYDVAVTVVIHILILVLVLVLILITILVLALVLMDVCVVRSIGIVHSTI